MTKGRIPPGLILGAVFGAVTGALGVIALVFSIATFGRGENGGWFALIVALVLFSSAATRLWLTVERIRHSRRMPNPEE